MMRQTSMETRMQTIQEPESGPVSGQSAPTELRAGEPHLSPGHAADGIEAFNDAGFAQFQAQALRLGFDECLIRQWDANTFIDMHTHSFGVQALVVQGEVTLGVGDQSQDLVAGSRFSLEPGIPHTERYGVKGAVFWVARNNPNRN
jgi:hypothetical protein